MAKTPRSPQTSLTFDRGKTPGGYMLHAKDFDTRVEPVDCLEAAPDFVTTFPGTLEGFIAAHDEAVAYLEDLIADCLETLKDLKDTRWINALDLAEEHAAARRMIGHARARR
jgi:ABC-type nitrate/sulfonate/bicarbonate transport system substrate-binding protein